MRGKTVIFSIVMLDLGFLISFSYQYTKQHRADVNRTEQWKKEYSLKSQLTKQEKANQKLEKELYRLQSKVQETEFGLKNEKEQYFNVLEDVEKYRMFTGEIGVKGKGVKVSLEDASYIPENYIFDLEAYNGDAVASSKTWYEFKMQHVLILGKDALIRTGISGEDSAKMYTKALGSSGVLDPIDQRQSIGFKINDIGFGSARLEAVVDYICVPSMANLV